jgi:hypothetical protein
VLQIVYTGLLVLAAVVLGGLAVLVVRTLFQGRT